MTTKPECTVCGDAYHPRRAALGYQTCLDCGDRAAAEERTSWTVTCTPKGHYTRITNKEELKCLNQKSR
jgi:hypothetical protein